MNLSKGHAVYLTFEENLYAFVKDNGDWYQLYDVDEGWERSEFLGYMGVADEDFQDALDLALDQIALLEERGDV